MAKTFRPYEPDQLLLLPPAIGDWVPEGHLARFVSELVEGLDLGAIEDTYEEERGYPPYHPRMMVKVLLYAYATGIYSSRRIARGLVDSVALRYLAAGNEPDFRTISDFRKRHGEALRGLFGQVLRLCRRAGLVKLGHVAVDGTKIKANASKHKAMSYGRMKDAEARLQGEVDELLRRAEETDEREDREYGKAPERRKHSDPLPPAPRGRIPTKLTLKERMRRKLQTLRGRAAYAKRQVLPEPVFGQIKQARSFRQFLRRGLEAVGEEWALVCTTHNILKLYGVRA